MLTISDNQMNALADSASSKFLQDTIRYIDNLHRSKIAQYSRQDLQIYINSSIAEAKIYGITSRHHIVDFIILRLEFGPDFPSGNRFSWARETLKNTQMSEKEKIISIIS